MSSHARIQLENWLKKIDVKADSVIDIGGCQLPAKGRTKSWDVKDYKVLDLEVPHECKQKPDICFDLDSVAFEPNKKFDIAFCLEVMEYISDPIVSLLNISNFLKKDGILYISIPFIYPLHPPTGKDYMRYTLYGASKLLADAGFMILETTLRESKNSDLLMDYWIADGYKFDKSEPEMLLTATGVFIKAKKL